MKSVESWDGFQQQKRGKKMQDNKPVDPKYLIKLGTPTSTMPVTRFCTAWDFFIRESDGKIRTVY